MACILIVEDDPEINALMALTLRIEDYDVLQARDGQQAIRIAQDSLPDLILMDVMMPRMSGHDVANSLQQIPETQHIPIIFVTAKSGMEDRVRGLETGFDYVCKPFAPPELLARVRVALRMKKLQEELRASNEQLAQLATTDALTGLYNRRQFDRVLEDELQRANRYKHTLSLIVFDIDFFKKVNDSWGHAQGDLVLQEFARVLEHEKRSIDVVARLGGEEFAAILPSTNWDGARAFAEKVRQSTSLMASPCLTKEEDGPICVTVSAGAAVYRVSENLAPEQTVNENIVNENIVNEAAEPTVDAETLKSVERGIVPEEVVAHSLLDISLSPLARDLLQNADALLYRAKTEGRNRVVIGFMQVPHEIPGSEYVR